MENGGILLKKDIRNGGGIIEYSAEVPVDPSRAVFHLRGHHEDWPVPQQGAAQRLGNLMTVKNRVLGRGSEGGVNT